MTSIGNTIENKLRVLLLSLILLGVFAITSAADDPAPKYYGSTKSDKYHKASCRYVKKIEAENLVMFESVKEARDAGYIPCKVCMPPEKD